MMSKYYAFAMLSYVCDMTTGKCQSPCIGNCPSCKKSGQLKIVKLNCLTNSVDGNFCLLDQSLDSRLLHQYAMYTLCQNHYTVLCETTESAVRFSANFYAAHMDRKC